MAGTRLSIGIRRRCEGDEVGGVGVSVWGIVALTRIYFLPSMYSSVCAYSRILMTKDHPTMHAGSTEGEKGYGVCRSSGNSLPECGVVDGSPAHFASAPSPEGEFHFSLKMHVASAASFIVFVVFKFIF
jgi:hypothetical protein